MEIDKEKNAFILSWSVSIWKRIWASSYLYCKHQNISLTADVVLKCFKYNILSPTGIIHEMLPSLKLALTQGFLMPKEYKNNKYVKRAVSLFGEAYKILKYPDKKKLDFIKEYAYDIDEKEYKDILNVKCDKLDEHCCFCKMVKIWDIELVLYDFDDSYHALLIYMLLNILDESR